MTTSHRSGAAIPRETGQIRALTRAFLARFFDNDMTGGSTDMQHSFFWLLAALATPGLVMPNVLASGWARTALAFPPEGGLEVLRVRGGQDLTFAIGVAMAGIGLVAALSWQSLLIERRDVQVLGPFPVRHRTVLIAKLGSLLLFFGIVTAATIPLSAAFYGLHFGMQFSVAYGFRLAGVHLLVCTLAAFTSYLVVIAVQGLALAITGPRAFTRIAPLLQLAVVGSLGVLFLSLPVVSRLTARRIYGAGATGDWVLWAPPTWFYGLHAKLMGGALPVLDDLSMRAGLACFALVAIVLMTYPLSYRRMVIDALIGAATPARMTLARRALAAVPALMSRSPVAQATSQFTLSTLGRVGTHRLVMSMAMGAAAAIIVPIVAANLGTPASTPPATLLAIPAVLMTFLLIGLRIAYAIPAELGAAWMFRAAAGQAWPEHRQAARRLMILLGVWVPAAATVPLYFAVWGAAIAALHAIVCLALGVLIADALLIDFDGVPCSVPFEPGHAQLESRWPWYLAGMNVAMIAIPAYEAELLRMAMPSGLIVLAVVLAVNIAIVRKWSAMRRPEPVTQESPGPASFDILLR